MARKFAFPIHIKVISILDCCAESWTKQIYLAKSGNKSEKGAILAANRRLNSRNFNRLHAHCYAFVVGGVTWVKLPGLVVE